MGKIIIAAVFSACIYCIATIIISKVKNISLLRKVFDENKLNKTTRKGLLALLVNQTAKINKKLKINWFKEKLALKIKKSGAAVNIEVDDFLAYKELISLTVLIIYFILFISIDIQGMILAASAFYLPDLWLKERRTMYEKSMRKDFVYFADIMTVCVEAGLSFDAAMQKYIEKSKNSSLKNELKQVIFNIKMGQGRVEALKTASKKINISEITSFFFAVTQSIELGTSMANTLRAQSLQIRVKRIQSIEKNAMQAPVKLLIPLIIFIFPVIFIVIFGPIIIKIYGMFN